MVRVPEAIRRATSPLSEPAGNAIAELWRVAKQDQKDCLVRGDALHARWALPLLRPCTGVKA